MDALPAAAPLSSRDEVAFCYLRDQQPLSPVGYQRARTLCDTIRNLSAGRVDYLRREALSPELHLPHANWELGSPLYDAYTTVVKGEYAVLNHLRLFSQSFTGYQLMTLARCAGLPIPRAVPPDLDEQLAVKAAQPSPDVNTYFERTACLPELLHLSPPNVFGEIGWLVNGAIVNHDTNVYLERVGLLAESGALWELRHRTPAVAAARQRPWRRPRILEIGAGYGGLAHYLRQLIPEARYFLLDIPESLLFSSLYLSTIWEQDDNVLITPENLPDLRKDSPGFTFLPNYLFDRLSAAGLEFDLVINTLSLSEMSASQVHYYCRGIAALLGDSGVFFEQNQDNRRVGLLDAKRLIAEHFPCCIQLRPSALYLTQGQPHLWATHWTQPYCTWRPSDEVLAQAAAPNQFRRLLSRARLGKVKRAVKALLPWSA